MSDKPVFEKISGGQEGFSLVELLIVIALIGILLGIASLQFASWSRQAILQQELKQMYSALTDARTRAMTRNSNQGVLLVNGNQYALQNDLNNDGDFGDAGEIGAVTTVRSQIRWGGNVPANDSVIFNARGHVTTLGTISMVNNDGATQDCIIMDVARISLGRMTGGACARQ